MKHLAVLEGVGLIVPRRRRPPQPEPTPRSGTASKDTANYYFGSAVTSDWKPGSPLDYIRPDGSKMVGGRVESIDPPPKLVTRFQPHWDGTPGRTTRVTYELAPAGGSVRLTLTHENLAEVDADIREGWEKIFAQIKTRLEAGKPLDIPRG
jgi:uncharacterized protein YndB with AHSA1/START domain